MTGKEMMHRIEQGEGPGLVFLPARSRPRRVGEALVALANTHGGRILLGVRGRQRGRVEGVPSPEDMLSLVTGVAQECTPPMVLPLPEVLSVDKMAVVVVSVPAGLPHVYHWQGLYLRRVGNENVPLDGSELRGLLLERSEEGFEALVPVEASLEDLDQAQIRAYAAAFPDAPEEPLTMLRQRGCLVDRDGQLHPTYAGLLLFARDPQALLPQARITLVRHTGTTTDGLAQSQDVRGTLPEQIHLAERFLASHMRRGRVRMGSEEVEVTEYPIPALREAIVNAVAHRDYSIRGDEIRLSMFQDRVEVYSPGRLPGPITVENILEERYSRNPVIVQVLADMGLIERLGYGIDRMFRLMEEAHLPAPTFRELRGGFLVTLRGPRGMAAEGISADPQTLARLGLNERQVQAMLHVYEQERISPRQYQELCPDVSSETLRRDLVDLVSRGLLLKVGERRASYYILK